jgi:hypothetical protein
MSGTSAGPPFHRNFTLSPVFEAESRSFRTALVDDVQLFDGAPVYSQPSCGSHESCVHATPSSQLRGLPKTQAPLPSQASTVQTLLSVLHAVVAGAFPSDGQVWPAVPVHCSTTSH